MDELTVNKTKYISSKRAHEITGYAKDYVGQLVRQGKLDARRVGRAWYVNEEAIKALAGIAEEKNAPQITAPVLEKRPIPVLPQTLAHGLPKTWGDVKYFDDAGALYPISDKREATKASEIATIYNKPTVAVNAEKVKITVIRPTVRAATPHQAAAVSFSGVRTQSGAVVVKKVRPVRASRRVRVTHEAGVLVGAVLFLLLAVTFF